MTAFVSQGDYTVLGTVHWVSASLALLIGGFQLFGAKGTPGHRRLGWVYAALLVLVNGTALVTYRETGGWNQFPRGARPRTDGGRTPALQGCRPREALC